MRRAQGENEAQERQRSLGFHVHDIAVFPVWSVASSATAYLSIPREARSSVGRRAASPGLFTPASDAFSSLCSAGNDESAARVAAAPTPPSSTHE